MDDKTVFLTICGMGAVTYLPRLLPMLLLSDRRLSPWIARWLSFVPATVLSALLAPGLLCRDGVFTLEFNTGVIVSQVVFFFAPLINIGVHIGLDDHVPA